MENFNSNNFRLYGKFFDQSRFLPFDIAESKQVKNLIFATIVPAENLEKLKQLVDANKQFCTFQIRDLNNKVVY